MKGYVKESFLKRIVLVVFADRLDENSTIAYGYK